MKCKILGTEGKITNTHGNLYYTFLVEDEEGLWNSTTGLKVPREEVERYVRKKYLTLFESPFEIELPDDWKTNGTRLSAVATSTGDFPHRSHGMYFQFWENSLDAECRSREIRPDYWHFLDFRLSQIDHLALAKHIEVRFLSADVAEPMIDLYRRLKEAELGEERYKQALGWLKSLHEILSEGGEHE